jgi:hypothetical protein
MLVREATRYSSECDWDLTCSMRVQETRDADRGPKQLSMLVEDRSHRQSIALAPTSSRSAVSPLAGGGGRKAYLTSLCTPGVGMRNGGNGRRDQETPSLSTEPGCLVC